MEGGEPGPSLNILCHLVLPHYSQNVSTPFSESVDTLAYTINLKFSYIMNDILDGSAI